MNHSDEYHELMERVRVIMDWDHKKAMIWMATKNPLLGDVEPAMMIIKGRSNRLRRFIEDAEDDVRRSS